MSWLKMDTERLEMMLFDDQRIVTALTLSRHSNCLVEDAKESLSTFYENHKAKNGLWAIYSITGYMERQGILCKSTILAKEHEMEEKKSNFQTVSSMEIFSLQVRDVQDTYSVFLADMMDDKDFFRTDNTRAAVTTKKLEDFRKKMETNHKDQLELITKSMEASANAVDVKPIVTKKSIIADKKPDIKKMFEKACTKEKTPKNSPQKVVRESPFSSPEKSCSSESGQKRRNRKIIIEDEDSLSPPPAKEPKKEPERTPEKEKKPIARSEKKESTKLLKEDIYDATASSPEKETEPEHMEVDSPVVKKNKKKSNSENKKPKKIAQIVDDDSEEKPEEPVVRRSPRKRFTEDVGGKRKKMVKAFETYVDEEGFLVTKEVLKEVSVEPEEPAVAKPLSPKKINQTTLTKPKSTKTATQQSKISSFFTKKA